VEWFYWKNETNRIFNPQRNKGWGSFALIDAFPLSWRKVGKFWTNEKIEATKPLLTFTFTAYTREEQSNNGDSGKVENIIFLPQL
jgi:hypothetical protein